MKKMNAILVLIIGMSLCTNPLQASHPENQRAIAMGLTLLFSVPLVVVTMAYQKEVEFLLSAGLIAGVTASVAVPVVVTGTAMAVGAGATAAYAMYAFPKWVDDTIEKMIDQETAEYLKLAEAEYLKSANAEDLKSNLQNTSENINKLITALLNAKVGTTNVPIFSTIASKKFVLQNIQDFFEFKDTEEHKFFNDSIYSVCIKKINELDIEAQNQDDTRKAEEQLIDDTRKSYMEKIGFKKEIVDKKLFIEQEMKRLQELSEEEKKVAINNAQFLALLSLEYWIDSFSKNKKEELLGRKESVMGKEALQQKAAFIKALRKLPAKTDENPYTTEQIVLKKQEILEKKLKSEQSWWSTVKSWFGY